MDSGWIVLFFYFTGLLSVLLIGEPLSLKEKSPIVSATFQFAIASIWWLLAWIVIGQRLGSWVKRTLRRG